MRDIVLITICLGALPVIIRMPWVGIMMWTWLSVMSPHRLTWGFAYDMPFPQIAAIATLVGLLVTKEARRLPLTPVTVTLLILIFWMNVTTLFALRPERAWDMWDRVMKIQFMVFVTLYLLNTKEHLKWFIWTMSLSLAFFGVKGGIFTILTGGGFRVWGPDGSFIEENNSLALATIMNIPMLRYLQLQAKNRWVRIGLLGAIGLSIFSALGSQSRGALLAIAVMGVFLWLKSRRKILTGLLIIPIIPLAIFFMPESWTKRMETIENYEQDSSAMGRINAWQYALNLADDRPLVGGGFDNTSSETFARYAPNPIDVHSPHSIYFQLLGDHGYPGFFLFLLFWFLVWQTGSWIRRNTRGKPDNLWAFDLASMLQVSIIGYLAGGAFLNLGYYDVPYNIMILLVLTRVIVEKAINEEKSKVVARPRFAPPPRRALP